MLSVTCEVLTEENGEEVTVGHINVFQIPRVGEYIWFTKDRKGHTSWIVEDVAHKVGDGELGSLLNGYQNISIYVKPTRLEGSE